MKNFLIYGTRTPLGSRILYYLDGWAKHRSLPVNVIGEERIPEHLDEMHHDMWQNIVGPSTPSRPDCIINCDLLPEHVSNASPTESFVQHTRYPSMLALAARAADIPYIQISSDRIFVGRGDIETEPKPDNLFGITVARMEALVRTLYPFQQKEDGFAGSIVLRLSTLYGMEIDSVPTQAISPLRDRVYADTVKTSPTFIGEAGWLIARNLLESPQAFNKNQGLLHVAPPDDPISMADFIQTYSPGTKVEVKEELRTSIAHGLVPTEGWFISRGYNKGWQEFVREKNNNNGQYLKYWS